MYLRDRLFRFKFSTGMFLFCLPLRRCFLKSVILRFWQQFEFFLSAIEISYLCHCIVQQISTHAFCSRDGIFSQEKNGSSPNNLRRSSKTTPSLTSNTFLVGKFKSVSCNILQTDFDTNDCQKRF